MFGLKKKWISMQMHAASGYNKLPRLLELIKKGADVNARDPFGGTPLMIAAKRGFSNIVSALLENGADPNATMSPPTDPKLTYTALHSAAEMANNEIVIQLIRAGANVNAATEYGETPLISAACFGNNSTVRILLEHGADKSKTTEEFKTAADYALDNGHDKTYELLAK